MPIQRDVRYTVLGLRAWAGSGRTINISSGGVLFTTQSRLREGAEVELTFVGRWVFLEEDVRRRIDRLQEEEPRFQWLREQDDAAVRRLIRGSRATLFASLPASVAAFHVAFGPDGWLYVTAPTLGARDCVYRIGPDGVVETFEVACNPNVKRCYGFTYREDDALAYATVAETDEVNSPKMAVKAFVAFRL